MTNRLVEKYIGSIEEDEVPTNNVGDSKIAGAAGDPPGPSKLAKLVRRIKVPQMIGKG